MQKNVSVLGTTKSLLDLYLASVRRFPNEINKETENLAYAIIYLANRYSDEFRQESWMDVFDCMIDQIDEIETRYRDMVVFQAPLWCCMNKFDTSWSMIDRVLDYGLNLSSSGRSIFLNYAYLISREVHYKFLLRFIRGYCKEGKLYVDYVLYLFMISEGSKDEKLAVLRELYDSTDVRRYPQVLKYIEPYLNNEHVENKFAYVDQDATNTILDFVLFRDLTMTKQIEIDFSDV